MGKLIGIIAIILAVVVMGCLVFLKEPPTKETTNQGAEEVIDPAPMKPSSAKPKNDFINLPGLNIATLTPAAINEDHRVTRYTSGAVSYEPSIALTEQLHRPEGGGESDLRIVGKMLGHYRSVYGENPVGNNREIVAQILGRNRKNVVFFTPNLSQLSRNGELLDRWENPYRFHAISGETMEIHSRGPDGEIWTDDDIQIRHGADELITGRE